MPIFKTIRATSCAVLGLLVAWQMWGDLRTSIRSAKASGVPDELAPFDSFSEPSLAIRVLKQEVERTSFEYTVARDQAAASLPGNHENLNRERPAGHFQVRSIADLKHESAQLALAVERMEQLRSEIEALNLDLDRRLTALYYDHHLGNEFLDSYLRLLHEGPERAPVVGWERHALEAARACGRSHEVVAALRQLIEFQESPKTAREVKAVLEGWQKQNSAPAEVSKR